MYLAGHALAMSDRVLPVYVVDATRPPHEVMLQNNPKYDVIKPMVMF